MNKTIIVIISLLFSTLSFAELTKCEKKIQDLMLATEKINYPESYQQELSQFKFVDQGFEISASAKVFVYNGDTIYRVTGHRLIYGDPKDCVVKKLDIEVLP